MSYLRPTYSVQLGLSISTLVALIGRSKIGTAVIGASAEDGVAWTTATGAQAITISRGRQDELSRIEAGRCTVILDNSSGDWSPENTGSPYYGDIKPRKRLRVIATFNGTDYPLFYGWIQRWRPSLDSRNQIVQIDATDLFLRLAKQKLNTTFSQQLTGARVQAVLALLEWPSSLQDIDAGRSTVPATSLANVQALQHLQDIMDVEDGLCWVNGQSKVVFNDRHARFRDAASVTSQATFGGASGLGLQPLEYDYPDADIYNDVRVTRTGGTEQTASDTASQRNYGVSTLTRSSDHLLNDADAKSLAGWLKGVHKDPLPHLHGIRLEGGGWDQLWTQMLVRTLGDRITVVHNFPGSLGINRDFWIEAARHHITDGLNRHTVEWQLSAADPVNWAQIGHATRGKIGTAIIGY